MYKSYYDHLSSFSSEEIYEGLLCYGMFSENLPPFLQSYEFFTWSEEQRNDVFSKEETSPVLYENIRSINIPRIISIPNPVSYRNLCTVIKENWEDILTHIRTYTENQKWKVSRIHVRKIKNKNLIFSMSEYPILESQPNYTKKIFSMGYSDYKEDDTPLLKLKIGARFETHADIANFFGSIYTHSLPWALVGKSTAKLKSNRKDKYWYNALDRRIMETNNGETHGILIGSHAYNLISELVLMVIDYNLIEKGYSFIRHIDDYVCLTNNFDSSEKFLIDLSSELRNFGLSINSKKISTRELPATTSTPWVVEITNHQICSLDYINYKQISDYLDFLLHLVKNNNDDVSVLKYGIKFISKKEMSDNAIHYLVNTIHHLVLLRPYLVSLLDKDIFERYGVEIEEIEYICNNILEHGVESKSYELIVYSIFFAIKHEFYFDIQESLLDKVGSLDDCIILLLCYLYEKREYDNDSHSIEKHKKIARYLLCEKEYSFWLYYYEVLSTDELNSYWKTMKKDSVSFISSEFRA